MLGKQNCCSELKSGIKPNQRNKTHLQNASATTRHTARHPVRDEQNWKKAGARNRSKTGKKIRKFGQLL